LKGRSVALPHLWNKAQEFRSEGETANMEQEDSSDEKQAIQAVAGSEAWFWEIHDELIDIEDDEWWVERLRVVSETEATRYVKGTSGTRGWASLLKKFYAATGTKRTDFLPTNADLARLTRKFRVDESGQRNPRGRFFQRADREQISNTVSEVSGWPIKFEMIGVGGCPSYVRWENYPKKDMIATMLIYYMDAGSLSLLQQFCCDTVEGSGLDAESSQSDSEGDDTGLQSTNKRMKTGQDPATQSEFGYRPGLVSCQLLAFVAIAQEREAASDKSGEWWRASDLALDKAYQALKERHTVGVSTNEGEDSSL
jgi:hypothetical protein